MHENRSDTCPSSPSVHQDDPREHTLATAITSDIAAPAILALLLAPDYHGPWTRSEIERELGSPVLAVRDALADLAGAGLLHLHGELVFATRAARRMDQLEM